ncbi:MAG: WecB/TagA/CpsF family glycosyltransferase [Bacillota bacterium]
MRKTANILGIPVDSITMDEAVERIGKFLEEGGVHTVYTPNAEIMMAALRDPILKDILAGADMLTADGAGVVLASRILGCRVPEKVSGVDLVVNIFKVYANKGVRVFLFGSKPGVAEEAAENIARDYPGVVIAGCMNGYFTEEQVEGIINEINATNADILLVALGAPKQEYWISNHKDKLNSRICIGVGGTLDILSGRARRAPDFFRKNGLEWLYRLMREPRRAKRMLDLPRFMCRVLLSALTGRKK